MGFRRAPESPSTEEQQHTEQKRKANDLCVFFKWWSFHCCYRVVFLFEINKNIWTQTDTYSERHVPCIWHLFTPLPLLNSDYVYGIKQQMKPNCIRQFLNIYWKQRVMMAEAWWVDGKINILRILRKFRQDVWFVAVMKGARMRKQQLLIDKDYLCVL